MFSMRGSKRNPKAIAAVALCGVALATAACSGPADPGDPTPTTTTPVAPLIATPLVAAGTVAELNANLARAFDETVPAAEKVALVQGAQADPQLIDRVVEAAKVNKASVEVSDVTDLGDGTVVATVVMTLDGQPAPESIMTFVAEDGGWKLSKDNACDIVGIAGLSSPACA
ncbi:Lipoprotein [Prescottella defluvii]|uniref:hypothetical protein n=1 Tax=Prescottella defluvii TaxID=1323361 RepID=UPI0004F275CB|nr:hypothetical protein [Prescottella defluvii]